MTNRAPSVWRVVGSNVGAKIIVLGIAGVLGIFTTRLIVRHFGVEAYAQYGLLSSMASLVPFADLGLSAAIINVVSASKEPRSDARVQRTIVSAIRLLLASTAVLLTLAILVTAFGLWESFLGRGLLESGGIAALTCAVIFALTLPLGVGQRVLTGLGKNHVQTLLQGLAGPIIFLIVLLLILSGATSGSSPSVAPYVATFLVAIASFFVAARMIRPQIGRALVKVIQPRRFRGERVMNVGWPMLAQMVALPIAMQTDRLLLSHLAQPEDLAQYNLGAQLFGMVTLMIGAAGVALWPMFAQARRDSEIRSPFGIMFGFLVGGLALAGILASLLPWIVPIASAGRISLHWSVVLGFVAFVGAQAAKYPLGMYMTDVRGLRFQVIPIIMMVPVNLAISWLLTEQIGAAGPIIGSAIAVALCQVAPNCWYVRRDLRYRRLASMENAASTLRP